MADDGRRERIIVVATAEAAALNRVRCFEALSAMASGDVWVRGIALEDQELTRAIAAIPCLARYDLDPNGRLFPIGARTPVARLPQGDWQPISTFIRPFLPGSSLPGDLPAPSEVRLLPCDEPQETSALLASLDDWSRFAATAPAVRLAPLQFAVDDRKQVLILGAPLPPIPGQEFVQHQQLLLPAGYALPSSYHLGILPETLHLAPGDYALFQADASWERVPGEAFVPASRSAVRATMEACDA